MRISRIFLTILAAVVLSGTATAYLISFEAPSWVAAGEPIPVTGTSTFPPDAQGSVIAYRAMPGNVPISIDYRVFTTGPDGTWAVTFDTDGWMATSHKLGIAQNDNYPLGSSSVTYRYVEVIDRSQDCVVTTPATQYWQGDITISGVSVTLAGGHIFVEVSGDAGHEPGSPVTVPVAPDGSFSIRYAVPGPGTYTVRYSDDKSLLTSDEVTVIPAPEVTPVPADTPAPPASETATPTRSSPSPLAGILAGVLLSGYFVVHRRGRCS